MPSPEIVRTATRRLVQMHYESQAGHLGGNLSCLPILLRLYHDVLRPDDTLVVSKGHAAGADYIARWSVGQLTDDDLKTFHGEGTKLPGHLPPCGGSLGHGLSVAVGEAVGRKLQGKPGRVYCLCSDGEMQEGQAMEAQMYSYVHKVPVTFIVDDNGWQGFGRPDDLGAGNVSFGARCLWKHWNPEADYLGPVTVFSGFKKGHGISFLDDTLASHYTVLTYSQYRQALEEVG